MAKIAGSQCENRHPAISRAHGFDDRRKCRWNIVEYGEPKHLLDLSKIKSYRAASTIIQLLDKPAGKNTKGTL